jgi:hypothetical protein
VTDNKQIEYLANIILAGKKIFSYQDTRYEIRKPSLQIKVDADILYQETYETNLFNDFILLEDVPFLCIDIGIISNNYEQTLNDYEKRLESAKLEYFSFYLDTEKRKKNKVKINNIKQQYQNYLDKIHYLDHISLEHYCAKAKNEFIIINTLYYYNTNNLVFDNYNSIDYIHFNNIINEINNYTIDIDKFKEICRSEYWRNLWSDSKYLLINDPVCDWSEEQKTLCSLSRMYDRIYEHPECPSDNIINDNDALDGWMIHQKRQNSKQKQEKGVDNMLPDKIKNSSEIFLMANSQEKAQTIVEFNDQQSLGRMNQKLNFVKSHSEPIRDAQLPDVQQDLIKQFRQQQGK